MLNQTSVRVIGGFATLWNAVGVFSYLNHVGVVGESPLPADVAMPAIVTASFAVGVFSGVAGALALLMLSKWARPLLCLSWLGTVVDWSWVLSRNASASVALGAAVLVIATLLVVVAEGASRRSVLR